MFTERDLRELAALESPDVPVLSLYLNVDPRHQTKDHYRLNLRHLLERVEDQVSRADVEAVQRFVEREYDGSGRGLAVFSAQARGLWRVFTLAVPTPNLAFVGRKPYVFPLAKLWDAYGRFLIALVDKTHIRLLFYQMGELRETLELRGEPIKRHKQGGWGAEKLQRHEDEMAYRNLKEAAELTVGFCERHQPRYLLLGGADPTVVEFRELLPSPWRDRIAGTIPGDRMADEEELREAALRVLQQVEREREFALVETAITAASKGANGVINLEDTLRAAAEGRVQVLLVADGFHAPAYRCAGCGFLTTIPRASCPFCGAAFETLPDAVDWLIATVLENGSQVEIVEGHPRLRELGTAALLRY
jgi:peptide subunit release factor 1 (eRF1)